MECCIHVYTVYLYHASTNDYKLQYKMIWKAKREHSDNTVQ